MMKMFAVRTVRLCTKDCLCLFVCPTGAADTENSVIDVQKCIGCGACANACPSSAISMVPHTYPPQQIKTHRVRAVLNELAQSKMDTAQAAEQVAESIQLDGLYRLMKAVSQSAKYSAQDVMREAGYMLPQSDNAHVLLKGLMDDPPTPEFPSEAAAEILKSIPNNEK